MLFEDEDSDDGGCPKTKITISNCVATAFLGMKIPLQLIASKCQGEFDPTSFAAAKLRLTKPNTTALVFGSGKIVCTGASSERDAYTAVLKYLRLIRRHVKGVALLDVNFQNIVSTASFGKNVDLKSLYAHLCQKTIVVRWNPEIFPGLRYQPHNSTGMRTFAVVFATGKVVLTAAKNREEIVRTWEMVWRDVSKFLTAQEIDHAKMVKKRRLAQLIASHDSDSEEDFFTTE